MYKLVVAVSGIILLFAFASCKSKAPSDNTLLTELENGTIRSNRLIKNATAGVIIALQEKTNSAATKDRAEFWLPKVESIEQRSEITIQYIDSLKVSINSANYKPEGNEGHSLLLANADSLYKRLKSLRQFILSADSIIKPEFDSSLLIINNAIDHAESGFKGFKQLIDLLITKEQATAFLTQLQNNILIAANKTVNFCFLQIGSVDGDRFYRSYEAIVGQNSQLLEGGKQLEIFAGLGSFSSKRKSTILIENKSVAVTEKGIAVYKKKTSHKPGTYHIPVVINFIDEDGVTQTRKIDVEYKVVEAIKKN